MTLMTDVMPETADAATVTTELLDVTVLAGGPGAEREVSLQSGWAVYEALTRLGYRAELSDIQPDDLSAIHRPADIVFIALHGAFGEDGTLQQELDRRSIRYTGSGAAASRLAMDKVEAKRRFQELGVPTPDYEVIEVAGPFRRTARFALPAVVKPIGSGSSVDTYIVRTESALQEAASQVIQRHGRALIEKYISGFELTVGILGDRALPVCEIRTKREFYDYQAKYVDDDTQYVFDLEYSAPFLHEVQRVALAAHEALNCRVFSRVDLMVDAETEQMYVLEVNTIPGFTSHSLLPKAAHRVGIDFDSLCRRIIELSVTERR
jgi:D-alanine-D-alanine ligase